MKKPIAKKSEMPSPKSSNNDVMDILNKLDPQQLVGLVDGLANLGGSYFEYGKEREKTKQTAIHATVKMREIDAELETKYIEHEQIMAQIQLDDRKDNRQFRKDIMGIDKQANELEKKDKQIHRILDLLEAGEISENELAGIIHALKQ